MTNLPLADKQKVRAVRLLYRRGNGNVTIVQWLIASLNGDAHHAKHGDLDDAAAIISSRIKLSIQLRYTSRSKSRNQSFTYSIHYCNNNLINMTYNKKPGRGSYCRSTDLDLETISVEMIELNQYHPCNFWR